VAESHEKIIIYPAIQNFYKVRLLWRGTNFKFLVMKKYTFEAYYNNNNLGSISVDAYEDNALWLATLKLNTITNINPLLIQFKEI
jgi:hypothetical protein